MVTIVEESTKKDLVSHSLQKKNKELWTKKGDAIGQPRVKNVFVNLIGQVFPLGDRLETPEQRRVCTSDGTSIRL